ncbi:MAG: TolC family protein [Ferruginibacter sp.]|nr:TolC family protein [Ferruginibacter sp.]
MIKCFIYIALSFTSVLTQAQDTLSLNQALNIALKNSLDVQIATNNLEANTILNNYGVAGGLPVVTGALNDNEQISSINQKLNTGQSISRDAAGVNNFNSNVSGSILLFNGMRVISTKKRLAQLQRQSESLLNSQVQNIMGAVMTAYYDIVRQQSYLNTIKISIEASNQQLTIVKARQEVGLANNADLFQAQIDLNALQQALLSQQLVIDQAKTELLRLLTLRADSLVQIRDTILVDNGLNLDLLLNNLNKNADIIAAQDQVRINELIVKETAAQRYPSVRGTMGYNFSRVNAAAGQLLLNQSYGPQAGINIGIPIYNGSIFRRQQRVAEINVRNADLDRRVLVRDYQAQLVTSFQAYAITLKQLETEKENYSLSQQLLDLALKRFQFRQATIVDVKNAQQSFEESGYRLVNLSYAAKSSEIELKRLANQLTLTP